MKRFPDIIVISWQCDCNAYLTHSVDLAEINREVQCHRCEKVYTLIIEDIDVGVEITVQGEDGEHKPVVALGEKKQPKRPRKL